MLEERNYTLEEWNNTIVPLVAEGELKDVSEEVEMGFLVIGQTMQAVIEDKSGERFFCYGWSSGDEEGYVSISKAASSKA